MRSLLGMPTQARHLGQVQAEPLNQPVDCITGSIGEDFDQVVSSEFTGRLLGIGETGVSAWPVRLGIVVSNLTIWRRYRGCQGPIAQSVTGIS